MTPTIGRIVHVLTHAGPAAPALVTKVHDDHDVNVRVFLDGSNETPAVRCYLHEDEETARAVLRSALPSKEFTSSAFVTSHAFWPSRG